MNRVAPVDLNESRNPMNIETIDLTDVKQIKKPNLEDLESFISQAHPYKQNQCRYTRCETCQLDTGCHSCLIGETSQKSQVDQFGTAASLYFRFVKNLSLWFLLFSIVASVPILFYIKAYQESSSLVEQFTASEKLTATTLGSLVIDRTQCQYLKLYDSTIDKVDQSILYLKCSTGELPTTISNYFYGFASLQKDDSSSSSCIYEDTSNIDTGCNSQDTSNLEALLKNKCYGQSSCEVKIDGSIFSNTCQAEAYSKTIYFNTVCENSTYQINWKFEKQSAVIISSVIDAGVILCFMFFLIKLRMSEEETEKNVISQVVFQNFSILLTRKMHQLIFCLNFLILFFSFNRNSVSVSYFTLEFTNLPTDFNAEDLKAKLWSHLESSIKKVVGNRETFRVFDVQLASPNRVVCSEKKIKEFEKQKLLIVLDYCQKFDLKYTNNQVSMQQIDNNYCNLADNEQRKEALKILEQLAKVNSLITAQKLILSNQLKQNSDEIKSAFVTFETMRMRDIAYYTMYQTQLDKLIESCFFCCKKKDDIRRFEYKLLEVKIPPSPEDIIWQNLSISACNKYSRRLISLFITIMFLIGTLVLIVYVKKENKSFNDKYPIINCPNNSDTLTRDDVAKDYESSIPKGFLECYCKISYFGRYDDYFTLSDGSSEQLCKKWVEDQTLILILPFMVVLAIIIINFIMQIIFTQLSKFEGYEYVSHQISSRVAKIFIMQFMNTALIILIMNTKFNSSGSTLGYLLDGTFSDFVPLWFKSVGTTILLTMLIYIIIPYLNFLLFSSYLSFRRWYDRKFSSNKSITRQKTQEAYEKVYLGPNFLIEVRYAQIMNIIFVCFLYCAGLPALFITTFLFLVSTYYIDKFTMLRMCRDPPQYGKSLEDIVRTILWLAVPFHCIMSIWMLGSPKMFAGSIKNDILDKIGGKVSDFQSTFESSNNNYLQEFFERSIKSQCIPQLIMLVVFVAYIFYLIIKKQVIIPLLKCLCCCFNFAEDDLISKKNELSLLPIHAFMTKKNLKSEIKNLLQKKSDAKNKNYQIILENKFQILQREFFMRKKENEKNAQAEQIEKQGKICTLVGLFSYDIEHHPDFV